MYKNQIKLCDYLQLCCLLSHEYKNGTIFLGISDQYKRHTSSIINELLIRLCKLVHLSILMENNVLNVIQELFVLRIGYRSFSRRQFFFWFHYLEESHLYAAQLLMLALQLCFSCNFLTNREICVIEIQPNTRAICFSRHYLDLDLGGESPKQRGWRYFRIVLILKKKALSIFSI